ncbi:hypothetical protein GCM10007216_18460 [Thalassobacillus devorans]|uniref:Uncharacterized protein n=1 Tax=Thalassobacillus devorans TaxID=279813 RepID=A0ABQ1P2F2_9BACI|nr:hypothetical protein [Thalassobacillus devorans]NIK28211.1 hypothetical protein [Thalassobacillus devorans]GGC88034.1 hypothetical protein GCM10007216_18460 [Thalassobacillus devorans]
MYIYKRINLDGSTWRSRSISTEKLFDEEVYLNKTLPASEVTFTNEPLKGDYDELCKRLSGEVKTYRIP